MGVRRRMRAISATGAAAGRWKGMAVEGAQADRLRGRGHGRATNLGKGKGPPAGVATESI